MHIYSHTDLAIKMHGCQTWNGVKARSNKFFYVQMFEFHNIVFVVPNRNIAATNLRDTSIASVIILVMINA